MTAQLAPVAADTTSAATRPYRNWTKTAEHYLLALIAEGRTGQQIARQLGTSERAIARHKQRVFRRLGAVNAPQAVAIAIRRRLIPATDRPSEAFALVGAEREVIVRWPRR
ncbi:response regulator transcription factor [Micromonospora aurantiaca (nom. illeg.)]|uniref:response regulator transcription factor n=1 Tax=Micromonospora aurantiaca (nom. illeg.) TaxID=47850 RepID=UPI0033FF4760